MMNMAAEKKGRIIGLDAIKVLACFCVVFMHTFRQADPQVNCHPYIYYFTRVAMPLFFMVVAVLFKMISLSL